MKLKLILLVFTGWCLPLFSQTTGTLNIVQDSRINSLIELHKEINQNNQKIDGFRIQIFKESGNEAVDKARTVSNEFLESFPDIPTYLSFGQPYYRVHVGNFRDRIEAEGYLKRIQKKYRQAFVIGEKIELPELYSFPAIKEEIQSDTLIIEEGDLP